MTFVAVALGASPALCQPAAPDDDPIGFDLPREGAPRLLAQLLPVPQPPVGAPAPLTPPLKVYPSGRLRREPRTGWAIGAGVTGLFAAATTLGLAIGAETVRSRESGLGAFALTSLSSLVAIIMVPIVATGGSAARRDSSIRGLEGLRIFGWILYGVGIAVGLASFITPITKDGAPPGLLTSAGALFATSALFISIDDFASYWQSVAEWGVGCTEIAPYASPIVTANGRSGFATGVTGCF
jgi:hypothetical protein